MLRQKTQKATKKVAPKKQAVKKTKKVVKKAPRASSVRNIATVAPKMATRAVTTLSTPQARFSPIMTQKMFFSADDQDSGNRQVVMTQLLTDAFKPAYLDVKDTSGGCGAFYQITVVSDQFQGKLTLARHRAVQTVLKDIIPQIHGLNLYTHTPQQWEELAKSKDTGV